MTTQEYINKLKFIVSTFEECLMRGDLIEYGDGVTHSKDEWCVECGMANVCNMDCRIGRTKAILKELREEKI